MWKCLSTEYVSKENKVFHDPCRHCVDYVYCTMFGRDILALYMGQKSSIKVLTENPYNYTPLIL